MKKRNFLYLAQVFLDFASFFRIKIQKVRLFPEQQKQSFCLFLLFFGFLYKDCKKCEKSLD